MKGFFIWVSISLYISIQLPRSDEKKCVEVQDESSIEMILQQFHINPDTCLTLIDNKPVPLDSRVYDGQSLTIVEVTSGG